MIGASLDLQKAVRGRLIANGAITALVPATSIFDRNRRPETFPCIMLGEGQIVAPLGLSRNRHEVYADIHIWTSDNGLSGVQTIADAIRRTLTDDRLTLDFHHVADLYVYSQRFMRDGDGIHSHAVMTLHAQLSEFA